MKQGDYVLLQRNMLDIPKGTIGVANNTETVDFPNGKYNNGEKSDNDVDSYKGYYCVGSIKVLEKSDYLSQGQRVILVEPYQKDNLGKTGTVRCETRSSQQKIAYRIDWDGPINTGHNSSVVYAKRLRLLGEASVNTKRPKVIHHTMKVVDGTDCFDKLGDFEVSPDDIEDYCANSYGEGLYIIKEKNENRGRMFKVNAPIKKYDIEPHRFN